MKAEGLLHGFVQWSLFLDESTARPDYKSQDRQNAQGCFGMERAK